MAEAATTVVAKMNAGEMEHHKEWCYLPETKDKYESFRDDIINPSICVWLDEDGRWWCKHMLVDEMRIRLLLLQTPREAEAWVKRQY